MLFRICVASFFTISSVDSAGLQASTSGGGGEMGLASEQIYENGGDEGAHEEVPGAAAVARGGAAEAPPRVPGGSIARMLLQQFRTLDEEEAQCH